MEKTNPKKRIKKLLNILKNLKNQDINNALDLDKLYPLDKSEREQILSKDLNNSFDGEYQSPLDRSSYNYNYMTIGEMGSGTKNVW